MNQFLTLDKELVLIKLHAKSELCIVVLVIICLVGQALEFHAKGR